MKKFFKKLNNLCINIGPVGQEESVDRAFGAFKNKKVLTGIKHSLISRGKALAYIPVSLLYIVNKILDICISLSLHIICCPCMTCILVENCTETAPPENEINSCAALGLGFLDLFLEVISLPGNLAAVLSPEVATKLLGTSKFKRYIILKKLKAFPLSDEESFNKDIFRYE